jgi:4a-hydroxytetrahydrobiopterin dehydratase
VARLSDREIDDHLEDRPQWERDGDRIRRAYSLDDFVEAVSFTERLVEPSESAPHHPDLEVSWGEVVVNLTTHDEGGLTEKDFNLAEEFDRIYREEFADE